MSWSTLMVPVWDHLLSEFLKWEKWDETNKWKPFSGFKPLLDCLFFAVEFFFPNTIYSSVWVIIFTIPSSTSQWNLFSKRYILWETSSEWIWKWLFFRKGHLNLFSYFDGLSLAAGPLSLVAKALSPSIIIYGPFIHWFIQNILIYNIYNIY